MSNGKPFDHPLTDILVHGGCVYSKTVDDLVREIAEVASDSERTHLANLLLAEYNDLEKPDVAKLEIVLRAMRDRLTK